MKQIFEWLREQFEEKSVQGFDGNGNPVNVRFVASIMAEDIITEAEAKWEADCCEWEQTGLSEPPRYFEAHDLMAYELDICLWKYCPICGKPIKISEVE